MPFLINTHLGGERFYLDPATEQLTFHYASGCYQIRSLLGTCRLLMSETLSQDTVQVSSLTFTKKDDNPPKVLPAGQQQQQTSGGNEGTSACIDPAPQLQDAENMLVVKDTEYIKLYKAVCVGDWSTGKHILDSDPDLLTTPICSWEITVIHMAAVSTRSASFLRELVDYMSERGVSLRATDDGKQNALHYAARSGNTEMARLLVEKDPTLAQEVDKDGLTPLHVAVQGSQTSVVCYLMTVTLRACPYLSSGPAGASLLRLLVLGGLYESAIELLARNPKLAFEREDKWGETALWILSTRPAEFPSGSRLAYWQRPLYQVYDWISERRDVLSRGDVENQFLCSKSICDSLISLRIFRNARERKSKHSKVFQLLKSLIEKTLDCTDLKKVNTLLAMPAQEAARHGIHEFVVQVIRAYPFAVGTTDNQGRTLFCYAVMHRQHEVFNLLFQLGSWMKHTLGFDNSFNTILHHAANWSTRARHRIEKIPGAALQMQRELQWYKKVEEVVQPSYRVEMNENKVGNNIERKRPHQIFTESHKELLKEGSEWMKGTANSYTIVAALVVTIAFAAAFTVPGGTNGDTGVPIFLLEISFMVFTISNMLAFFSSATSLLMFLGILTSRYSQEDFLRALPLKLSIGLISLFFSITSMLVAFTAGIHVMVSKHVPWIAIPAGLLACVSATLFGFLQAPLLVEVVYSTFGPSIFGPKSAELLL